MRNSIVGTARLVAFIAMTFVCLLEEGTDAVGSRRQKLYHETIEPFLDEAYSQIIGKVLHSKQDWVPYKLQTLTIMVHARLSSSSVVHSQEAMLEIFVLSLKRRFIAISWNWFRQYITIDIVAVHDCYIAKYYNAINDLRLLEISIIGSEKNTEQFLPFHEKIVIHNYNFIGSHPCKVERRCRNTSLFARNN